MRQFQGADNMTDRQGALGMLANSDTRRSASQALAAFYDRYRDNALVLDKWFTVQALSTRDDTPDEVERLAGHPRFHPRQSQPAALAGRRLRGQPARLPPRRRAAAIASSPT